MSGGSFQVDLDVVEGAAQQIQRTIDDLLEPTARLQAVVRQITGAAYGTDQLGQALTGGSSGGDGLPQHQDDVLAGIHQYLQNSTTMAQNLLTMCRRYRAVDDQYAAELRAISGSNAPLPASTPTTFQAVAPVSDPGWSAPTSVVYQDPTAPNLGPDQSSASSQDPQPASRPTGHQLS